MKAMKKLMAMLMMAGMVFAFPACGGDDDDEKIQDPNEIGGIVDQAGSWSESGDKMTYTHSYGAAGYTYQEKWVFTMKNGVCTAAETQITCPSDMIAELTYQEYLNDPEEGVTVSRNGKVITVKYTDTYIGMDKETIKMMFDMMFGGEEM